MQANNVILCDDVRREVTGKDIIIGVYGGKVAVGAYPAMISAAIWIELEVDRIGRIDGEVQIATPSGNPPVSVVFQIDATELGPSPLAVGGLPIVLEHDGEITISLREPGGNFEVIKRKVVQRGEPPFPQARPT